MKKILLALCPAPQQEYEIISMPEWGNVRVLKGPKGLTVKEIARITEPSRSERGKIGAPLWWSDEEKLVLRKRDIRLGSYRRTLRELEKRAFVISRTEKEGLYRRHRKFAQYWSEGKAIRFYLTEKGLIRALQIESELSTLWKDFAFAFLSERCRHCGKPILEGSQFCASCGGLVSPPKRCTHCHARILEGSRFCSNCGERVTRVT